MPRSLVLVLHDECFIETNRVTFTRGTLGFLLSSKNVYSRIHADTENDMDIFKGLQLLDDHDPPEWVSHLHATTTSDLDTFMQFVDPNSVDNMTKMTKTICLDDMEVEVECPGGTCVQLATSTLPGFYQFLRTFISTSLLDNGWKSSGTKNIYKNLYIYIYIYRYIPKYPSLTLCCLQMLTTFAQSIPF